MPLFLTTKPLLVACCVLQLIAVPTTESFWLPPPTGSSSSTVRVGQIITKSIGRLSRKEPFFVQGRRTHLTHNPQTTTRQQRRAIMFRLFVRGTPTPSPEESQSAFLALLHLSKLLEAKNKQQQQENSESGEIDDATRLTSSANDDKKDSIYLQPSIQLAVGAAKAFGAIDRHLETVVGALASLNESLLRMASEESKYLARILSTADGSVVANKQEMMTRSVKSVKDLVRMDQRITTAIRELHDVTTAFAKAEATNNNFMALLAESNPMVDGDDDDDVGFPAVSVIQEQALETSQAFDEIDDQLSKAKVEVEAIGTDLKTLQESTSTSSEANMKAPQGPSEVAPSLIPPTQYAPPAPLSSPGLSYEFGPPKPRVLVSSSPAVATATKTTPVRETTPTSPLVEEVVPSLPKIAKVKVEAALHSSIQVAQAFDRMDAAMALNDEKMIQVLDELRTSVQRLANLPQTEEKSSVESTALSSASSKSPIEATPKMTSNPLPAGPVSSTTTSAVNTSPTKLPSIAVAVSQESEHAIVEAATPLESRQRQPSAAAVAADNEETLKLSQAAAEAWEHVNTNMMHQDEKAITVLQELSESFRALAASDNFLGHLTETKVSPPEPVHKQEPDVQVTIPIPSNVVPAVQESRPTLRKEEATPHEKHPNPSSTTFSSVGETVTAAAFSQAPPSAAEAAQSRPVVSLQEEKNANSMENEMKLAMAAAEAFNQVNDDMTQHYHAFLTELRDLQASLQAIVDKPPVQRFVSPAPVPSTKISRVVSPKARPIAVSKSRVPEQQQQQHEEIQSLSLKHEATKIPIQSSVVVSETSAFADDNEAGEASSYEMASAFQDMDSNMNANDERMFSALREISASLKMLAGIDGKIATAPTVDTKAPRDTPNAPLKAPSFAKGNIASAAIGIPTPKVVLGLAPDAQINFRGGSPQIGDLSTLPTQRQSHGQLQPQQSSIDAPTAIHSPPQSTSTEDLSLLSANAFDEVNAAMTKNERRMQVILQEIRSSLELMCSKNVQQASTRKVDAPRSIAPVEILLAHTPLPKQPLTRQDSPVVSTDREKKEEDLPPVHQTELATEEAIEEAARAFRTMDAFMVKNDERTLLLLTEIGASFSQLAKGPVPAMLSKGSPNLQTTEMQPENSKLPYNVEKAEQVPVTAPLQVEPMPPESAVAPNPVTITVNATPEQSVPSEQPDAYVLAIEAAAAFDKVDSDMNANDERMMDVLNDISSNLKSFVKSSSEDLGAAGKERPQQVVVARSLKTTERTKIEPPPALSPPTTSKMTNSSSAALAPAALVAHQQEPEVAEEPDLSNQLGLERAAAFDRMDSAMTANDEKLLAVLNDIRASLKLLDDVTPITAKTSISPSASPDKVEVAKPTPTAESVTQEAASIYTTDLVADTDQEFQTISELDSTIMETSQADIASEEAKAQTILDTARAFESMDENMVRNDERALAVLHEISSSLSSMIAIQPEKLQVPESQPFLASMQVSQPIETAPQETPAPVPLLATPKPVESTTIPTQEPTALSVTPEQKREVQSQKPDAYALAIEAAAAFDRVDLDMNANDKKMMVVLNDISSNLKAFVKSSIDPEPQPIDTAPQKTLAHVVLPATHEPVESIAIPTQEPTAFSATPKKEQDTQPQKLDVYALAIEAAAAFDRVDSDMNANDERMMDVLNDISSNLQAFVKSSIDPKPATKEESQQLAVASLPEIVSKVPVAAGAPRVHQGVSVVTSPVVHQQEVLEPAVIDEPITCDHLGVEAAEAFDRMDSAMVANDEKSLAVLNDIRASLKLLEDVTPITAKTSISAIPSLDDKKLAKPIPSKGSAIRAFPAPTLPTTVHPISEPVAVHALEDTNQADAAREEAKVEGILETARAFESVGENMVKSDERTLAVLNEISASLSSMVDLTAQKPMVEQAQTLLASPPVSQAATSTNTAAVVAPQGFIPVPVAGNVTPKQETLAANVAPKQAVPFGKPDAYVLAIEAAAAFDKVNSDMNANDEKMMDVLNDISSNLKSFVEPSSEELGSQVKEDLPQIEPDKATDTITKISTVTLPSQSPPVVPVAAAPVVPVARQPVVQEQLMMETEVVEKEAIRTDQMAVETADAFCKVDRAMVANDERAHAVLVEIRASLKQLEEMEPVVAKACVSQTSPAKAEVAKPAPITDSVTQEAASVSFSAPTLPTKVQAISKPTAKHTLEETSQVDVTREEAKVEAILQTARAFDSVDENMVKNDERALAVLNEISYSLSSMIDAKPQKLQVSQSPLSEESMPGPKPLQKTPQQVSTTVLSPPTPELGRLDAAPKQETAPTRYISNLPGDTDTGVPDEYEQKKEDSLDDTEFDLSLATADAFNNIERVMSQNDERSISILREIGASFKRLVEADSFASKAVPTVTASDKITAPEPALLVELTPPEIPKTVSSVVPQRTVEANVKAQRPEEETRLRARAHAEQLSEKLAQAFIDVDANMMKNDEKMLDLLTDMKHSFGELAKIGNLPPPPNSSHDLQAKSPTADKLPEPGPAANSLLKSKDPANLLLMSKTPVNTEKQRLASLQESPQAPPEKKETGTTKYQTSQEFAPVPRHYLSPAIADVFKTVDHDMTKNDEIMLREFREMSALFRQLASKPSRRLFSSPPEPPDDSNVQQKGKGTTGTTDEKANSSIPNLKEETRELIIEKLDEHKTETHAPVLETVAKDTPPSLGLQSDTELSRTRTSLSAIGAPKAQERIASQPPISAKTPTQNFQAVSGPVFGKRRKVTMTSAITGKRITQEEYERRKIQVTEGAVEEMGTVLNRGLDNRFAELNKISSMFKGMVQDGGANQPDEGAIQPELKSRITEQDEKDNSFKSSVLQETDYPGARNESSMSSAAFGYGQKSSDLSAVRPKGKSYMTPPPQPGVEATQSLEAITTQGSTNATQSFPSQALNKLQSIVTGHFNSGGSIPGVNPAN